MKHTIKQSASLLKSCLSMLDALQSVHALIYFRGKYYKQIAHLFASGSTIAEPWCYDRIVNMYNAINEKFVKL